MQGFHEGLGDLLGSDGLHAGVNIGVSLVSGYCIQATQHDHGAFKRAGLSGVGGAVDGDTGLLESSGDVDGAAIDSNDGGGLTGSVDEAGDGGAVDMQVLEGQRFFGFRNVDDQSETC